MKCKCSCSIYVSVEQLSQREIRALCLATLKRVHNSISETLLSQSDCRNLMFSLHLAGAKEPQSQGHPSLRAIFQPDPVWQPIGCSPSDGQQIQIQLGWFGSAIVSSQGI